MKTTVTLFFVLVSLLGFDHARAQTNLVKLDQTANTIIFTVEQTSFTIGKLLLTVTGPEQTGTDTLPDGCKNDRLLVCLLEFANTNPCVMLPPQKSVKSWAELRD